MWKLRPLAIIDFHYDNKKVQENPKTPHPIVFFLFAFFYLSIPPTPHQAKEKINK